MGVLYGLTGDGTLVVLDEDTMETIVESSYIGSWATSCGDYGGYIYVGNYDKYLRKFDPADASVIDSLLMTFTQYQIVSNSTYLYVAGGAYTAIVDPFDMSLVASVSGGYDGKVCANEDYAYRFGAVAALEQLDPNDLEILADIEDEAYYNAIASDGHYVYTFDDGDSTVIKIDPEDLSVLDRTATYGADIYSVAMDGTYIYYGGGRYPNEVIKANISDMELVVESASLSYYAEGLALSDKYVYLRGYGSEGGDNGFVAYQLDIEDLSWDGIGIDYNLYGEVYGMGYYKTASPPVLTAMQIYDTILLEWTM